MATLMKPQTRLDWKPGRRFVIGLPFVWLLVFFLLPFLILLRISVTDMAGGIDPFAPLVDAASGTWRFMLKYDNYASIFRDSAAGSEPHLARRSTWTLTSRPSNSRR